MTLTRDERKAALWRSYEARVVDLETGQGAALPPSQSPLEAGAISPGGAYLALAKQHDGEVVFHRMSDGTRLATWHPASDDGRGALVGSNGEVELLPDEPPTRALLRCHAGDLRLPFEVCEERFVVKGRLARVLAEGG